MKGYRILDEIKLIPGLKPDKKPPKKKVILLLIIILVFIVLGAFFYKTGFIFSKIITIKNIAWERILGKLPSSEYMPPKDRNRINVLLLGIGGKEHPEGSLLADSIMIISFKKSSGKIALISIPRDLYVQMPGEEYFEKINDVYVLGEQKYQNGLDYSKKTIGYITGLHIDYTAVVDFEAFKTVVDDLGGVAIHLDKPFIEDKQWWCDENGLNCRPFIVEAGDQTLDGDRTLLYVRSRFSSSDFDRARRQQQVMLAIKDKVLSLGVLTNPLTINNLLDAVAENVKTDIVPWEFPGLIKLANKADTEHIIRKVFDISEEGLLSQAMKDGIYILLPIDGDFSRIRETCQKIFE